MEEQRALMKTPKSLAGAERETRNLARMLFAIDVVRNCFRALYNTLPFVKPLPIRWSTPPINLGSIVRLLNQVQAYEILIEGCFHGDPVRLRLFYFCFGAK